ncbi:DUF2267 domain-containing protein [bacterium]|nr:DUF2267 domain-containing protein [bacterium]
MDQLISQIVAKTGLSEDVARKVVGMVVDFLKKKLPAPIAGQIDSVLGKSGGKEGLTKGLSNLIGKK